MSKPLLSRTAIVLATVTLASCVTNVEGSGPAGGGGAPPANTDMTFGESEGTLASDAEEMMGKGVSNPNPKTLAGLYERTGYGSEQRPDEYLVLSNDWRFRVEIRADKIAAAMECKMEAGGAADAKQTILVYGTSPISVEPWGIRILEHVTATKTWAEYGVGCNLDLSDDVWPYCIDNGRIPEGYSSCIFMANGRLYMRGVDGSQSEVGKKIRN